MVRGRVLLSHSLIWNKPEGVFPKICNEAQESIEKDINDEKKARKNKVFLNWGFCFSNDFIE